MNDSPDGDDSGSGEDGFPWSGPGLAGDEELTVSPDALFEILSKRRCRLVLSYLETSQVDVVELDDLVEHVVEREAAMGTATDADDHPGQVATTLHHRHLPRLSVTSLLDYDARSKTIRYWGDDRVATYLDAFRPEDDI